MAVRINRKICDNADACGGIEACPTGAIYWDSAKQLLSTDDSKCTSCGACEDACPVGAILWASDEESLKKIEADIAVDDRTLEMLMVERYGAMPVDDSMQIDDEDIDSFVKASTGIVLIEENKESTIACLLQSIPISQLQIKLGKSFTYRKTIVDEGLEGEFPRLLIFINTKKGGVIDGFFEDTQIGELAAAICDVIK
jgi:ferredoxin